MTEDLTPEQEGYLEEEARERHFEKKHRVKVCPDCNFEYSGNSCPVCEEQLGQI
jgi:predicted RNA-binding protein with PUA domain